jgi:integrase/recombinase XerD
MLEAFLSRDLGHSTRQTYSSVLKRFINYLTEENISINNIQPGNVLEYVKNYKKTTRNKIISIVKTYYKYVTRLDLAIDSYSVNSFRIDRNLHINDVRRLIKYAKCDRDRLIMKALFITGLRVAELASIKKSDIKKENGSYYLYFIAKGNEIRKIKLPNVFATELLNYCSSKDTLLGVSKRHIERIIANLSKEVLGKVVTPHCFRHGFATELMKQGVAFKRIQEELGHKNIETTLRYLHNGDLRQNWYIDL